MIRDPSDGTVREKEIVGKSHNSAETPMNEMTSALSPTTAKADYLARLEMSREWLRDYRKIGTTTTE